MNEYHKNYPKTSHLKKTKENALCNFFGEYLKYDQKICRENK